jgi:hypothetical protein
MFIRRIAAAAAMLLILGATACSSLITAYLINELLNDKAPRRSWTGTVTDQGDHPVEGVNVTILAEVSGDDNILKFEDTTDDLGKFDIKYRWSKEVSYTLKVTDQSDRVIFQQNYGTVELDDRNTDITITGSFGVQLSGVVRDSAGDPLGGVALIGATASSLTETPSVLLDADDNPLYVVTNEAGVFTLTGTIGRYGIVCAYHPDHGFAYGYGEDLDNNNEVAINIDMGNAGRYNVDAQVIDALGTPLANRVLEPDQQFRIVCSQPFNLSETMDTVVQEEALFPSLVTKPSVQHPVEFSFVVAATGVNGVCSGLQNVLGGNYSIRLLKVGSDNPATALVISDNPLILGQNQQIVVRVND